MPSPRPPDRLYAIADADTLGAEHLPAAVETMAEAGLGWIQVRAKSVADAALYRLLEDCVRRLEGSSVALWIDDRADLAALLPVAGVHVGQDDLPPGAARAVVGDRCWIGRSTHDAVQAAEADADPAVDLVALGPIFDTTSKKQPDPTVGLATLARVRRATKKPLVAIGGIDGARLGEVLATGVDGAVVLGAVCRGDLRSNCKRLLATARAVAGGETSCREAP